MIDLHAHVLPGIDDGPSGMAESIALAQASERDGVTTLALTPHLRGDYPAVVPHELPARRDELAKRLAEEGCGIELVSGGELDLAWAHRATTETLRLVSYGQAGTDLLVETPYGELPHHFENMLAALRDKGFRLLLAHPERNPTLRRDPARLRGLVERGALVQLTASSLAGPKRSRSRGFALAALRERMAHVIASDAHGAGTVERAGLSEGLAAASAIDRIMAEWMVTEAPAAILAGAPLRMPPLRARRGGRLRVLRRGRC